MAVSMSAGTVQGKLAEPLGVSDMTAPWVSCHPSHSGRSVRGVLRVPSQTLQDPTFQ